MGYVFGTLSFAFPILIPQTFILEKCKILSYSITNEPFPFVIQSEPLQDFILNVAIQGTRTRWQ